jgi:hypothetical protein
MKKKTKSIDYFAKPASNEEAAIRRIKGNFRREFVMRGILGNGLASVPPAWLEHDLSMFLKDFLTSTHPTARGGEDLPDLEAGEVEIARLSLTNSVHAEVTSLRARNDGKEIALRMVDEYATAIELPFDRMPKPLGDEEVFNLFKDAEPSPMNTGCEFEFQSFFHKTLNGFKRPEVEEEEA